MDDLDVEQFIQNVQNHPCIWDKDDPNYKSNIVKERSWRTIARNVLEEWTEDERRQKELVAQLKGKWKSFRDQYFKAIKGGVSGEPATKRRRKYVWSDALSFLSCAAERRPTSANLDDPQKKDVISPPLSRSPSEISMQSASQPADPLLFQPTTAQQPFTHFLSTQPPLSQTPSTSLPKKPRLSTKPTEEMTTFQSSLLKSLDYHGRAEKERQNMEHPEDPDRSYLMSLLPDFKMLNVLNKWEFREMVAKFFISHSTSRIIPSLTMPSPQLFYSSSVPTSQRYHNPSSSPHHLSQSNPILHNLKSGTPPLSQNLNKAPSRDVEDSSDDAEVDE